MRIKDFMDMKELQNIQDQFSTATGLAAIAVDAEGNYITKESNFTDFCIHYTRGSEEGLRRCVKCDTECSGVYFCHAGLMDFSADIIVEGEKVGAMIGGQVLPNEPDEGKFSGIAEELGIAPEEYIRAVRKVPVRSEREIRAAAGLLGDIVNKVVNLEYLKYQNDKKLRLFNSEITQTEKSSEVIKGQASQLVRIATKQNILALNATIEAARAGTTGAGFSVVARQMGELSRQSADVYAQLQEMAGRIYESVQKMSGTNEKK